MSEDLSAAERAVLDFLDTGRMEANSRQIGEHIIQSGLTKGSNYLAVGGALAARLRARTLVMRISDLNAWRITRRGREALIDARIHGQSSNE
jgi:hypothetical protein